MTVNEKLKRLESIIIPHLSRVSEDEAKNQKEARVLLEDLQQELRCGEKCPSWDQTDNFTPRGGRCKQKKSGGVNVMTFEGDPCLFISQDAA